MDTTLTIDLLPSEAFTDVLESEASREPDEFHSLSRAEIEVFRIDPRLAIRINEAHSRYESLILPIGGLSQDEVRQADWDRKRFKEYITEKGGQPVHDQFAAARFMHKACDLPYDQCYAWAWKHEFTLWRAGLVSVPDEEVWNRR